MNKQTYLDLGDGVELINGSPMMGDGKGGWQLVETMKPQDKLQDQPVRTILGYAVPLSDQVSRFKQHTFDDIGTFEALIAERYGAKVGGKKGNMTLYSADRLYKVEVRIADQIDFGPELQTAKELIDTCLNEWAARCGPWRSLARLIGVISVSPAIPPHQASLCPACLPPFLTADRM